MLIFEREVTVLVLDQNETPIGYLNPNRVQLSETNELYSLRNIDITHPSFDESNTDPTTTFIRYDNYLANGNKLFLPESPSGDSCLYILLGDNEKDFKGNINQYAEEAATELTDNGVIRLNTTVTVTSSFLQMVCGELFTPGTITGPYNTPTTLNGAYTPLEILRAIETSTGGEFKFRYTYENGQINRYIDFMAQSGVTHSKIIEVGQNASDIGLKVNEQDVRIAAAPKGVPSSDASSFHAAMSAFEAAEFNKSVQIPLYVSKDDAGNTVTGPLAYPTYAKPSGQNYVECDNSAELVANYQRIQASKTSKAAMASIVGDNFDDNIIGAMWTQNKPTGAIAETSNALNITLTYGVQSTWTGGGVNNAPIIYVPIISGDITMSVKLEYGVMAAATSKGLFIMLDRNNWYKMELITGTSILVTKVTASGSETSVNTVTTTNQAVWFQIRRIGTTYYFEYSYSGVKGTYATLSTITSLGFTPAYVGLEARNWSDSGAYHSLIATFNDFIMRPLSAPTAQTQPRVNTFETSETNLYNLYWLCVTNIKSSLQPEVAIDSTVVDLQKLKGFDAEHYNTGDTVKIKLPDGGVIVEARITKTVKDPRKPESDALTIGNYQTDFMKQLYRNYYKSAGNVTL